MQIFEQAFTIVIASLPIVFAFFLFAQTFPSAIAKLQSNFQCCLTDLANRHVNFSSFQFQHQQHYYLFTLYSMRKLCKLFSGTGTYLNKALHCIFCTIVLKLVMYFACMSKIKENITLKKDTSENVYKERILQE